MFFCPLIHVCYWFHFSFSFLFKTLIWICFYPCDKFYLGLFWQCFTASPLWWWHIKKRVWIRVDTNSKYTLQSVSPLFGRSEACFIISIGLTHPDHITWMNHERPISDHLLIETTFISWDFPKVTARILKPRGTQSSKDGHSKKSCQNIFDKYFKSYETVGAEFHSEGFKSNFQSWILLDCSCSKVE